MPTSVPAQIGPQKKSCDSDQTTFESNFCVYKSVLDVTCLNHDSCHTRASSGATTTKARVEGTEAARKDAYKAGEEIVCRINALLANRAYSECDNLTVNTSNYSIVYPTADAKDSCVTEAEKPCDKTWKDTEYNALPSNAPSTTCTPCQAPSMAPTVAPTTQPIQASVSWSWSSVYPDNTCNLPEFYGPLPMKSNCHVDVLAAGASGVSEWSRWCARNNGGSEYLQACFVSAKTIGSVLVQKGYSGQYITGFRLQYLDDDSQTWKNVDGGNNFPLSYGGGTKCQDTSALSFPVTTTCMRILPTSYHGWKSFRVQFQEAA